MGAPEVDFVLSSINDDWVGGEASLADVPLERIDRDNAENLDAPSGWTHLHSEDPEQMNYVMASLNNRPQEPMGTEFDVRGDAVVGVRVVGLHVDEHGAIDPNAGTGDAVSVSWNTTTWDSLTDNIRRTLYVKSNREYPGVGRSNSAYLDLRIENWTDQSQNFSDAYLLTFEVRFHVFESLPT